jgi:hypothetical protein
MEKSHDSSLLRSLAVAFGDGLAFGVGMKLTQNTAAKPGTPAPSDLGSRLGRIEQRVERMERTPAVGPASGAEPFDPGVLDALMHAVEARLQENAGQTERRLAELEVKLAMDLKAVRQQEQAVATGAEARIEEVQQRFQEQVLTLRQKVNDDRNALQNQVVALHREFAAAVADIVEEQVANQVEQRVTSAVNERMAALADQIRDEIRQASAGQHREFADLRQRVTETDRNVLDVLLSIGDQFRQAANRLGAPDMPAEASRAASAAAAAAPSAMEPPAVEPVPPQPAAPEPQLVPPKPPDTAGGLYADSELPGFAQPRKASAVWSIPLVSSFLLTAGCVLVLQYL